MNEDNMATSSGSPAGLLNARAYQHEMLAESLKRNIIVAVRLLHQKFSAEQKLSIPVADGHWKWQDPGVRATTTVRVPKSEARG
jgi:hypothetical protein